MVALAILTFYGSLVPSTTKPQTGACRQLPFTIIPHAGPSATDPAMASPPAIPKLTESNYAEWAPQMKNALRAQLVWGIVQGREREPAAEELKEPFFARQDFATSQIFLTCDSAIQQKIGDIDDPVELWNFLKTNSEKAALVDEYRLRKQLYSIEFVECGSVAAYVEKIQNTIDGINTCNPDEPVGPGQHCFVLCDGLPAEWLPFIEELHKAGKTSRNPADLIKQFLSYEGKLNLEKEKEKEKEREEEEFPVHPSPSTPNNPPPAQEIPPTPIDPSLPKRSKLETHDIANLAMSFRYTHSNRHFPPGLYESTPVSSFAVTTNRIEEIYPELCRRIYINDRKSKLIAGNEAVGDIYIYIKPYCPPAGEPSRGSMHQGNQGSKLQTRKLLLAWIFENEDWREQLLDNFWDFPGSGEVPPYILEVEYKEGGYHFLTPF